jgi:hypothetical protein
MRMTRAALRAQAQDESEQFIHEDADAESFHASPDSSGATTDERAPLKDITTETNPATNDDPFADAEAPVKKAKGKKKDKLAKKDQIEEAAIANNSVNTSQPSEREYSLEASSEAVEESSEAPIDNASQAVVATPQHTSRPESAKTPRFNPSVHKPVAALTPAVDTVEDSFIDKITSRTPGRMLSFEERRSPDSFVESRTPRIEDSVDAIDALEDAIEKVAEDLPALEALKIESPIKARTPARLLAGSTPRPSTTKKPIPSPARNQRLSPAKGGPTPKAPSAAKPARPSIVKPVATRSAPITKPPAVAKLPKKPIVDGRKTRPSSNLAAAPALSFSNSPAPTQPNVTKKRIPSESLSTSRPAFVPAKSTKPPTKSTFSLPGEAISAKVKAQREERLRREEEAEKEKKTFKARPIPAKISRPSVVPRETKASQARISSITNGTNKENVAPKPGITIQPPKVPRPTSLDANKPGTKANSSVRRTTTTSTTLTTVTNPRISSLNLTTGQKSTVTKFDSVTQKAKGKEVFGRTKAQLEQAEKERKEKEEATRKARLEAAERGRQASREWAEKQRAKIAKIARDKILAEQQGGREAVMS